MAGAGSTLAEHGDSLDAATRAMLARSIETKAREMSELVSNVLDLTRFDPARSGCAATGRCSMSWWNRRCGGWNSRLPATLWN